MFMILSRFRKRQDAMTPTSHPQRQNCEFAIPTARPISNETTHIPPLHRKIHPDLDSLVTGYAPPNHDLEVAKYSDPSLTSGPDSLSPSHRGHAVNGKTRSQSMITSEVTVEDPSGPSGPQTPASHSSSGPTNDFHLPQQNLPSDAHMWDENGVAHRASSVYTTSPMSPTSVGSEPSTFGQKHSDVSHTRKDDTGQPIAVSNQDRCRMTSASDTSTQPPTPTSTFTAQAYETPSNSISSCRRNRGNTISSSHTFGIPTPPSSNHTFGPRPSFHTQGESPPPLPPLDHPAFQLQEPRTNLSKVKDIFSGSMLSGTLEQPDIEKHPRHSTSLPSFYVTHTPGTNRKKQYTAIASRSRSSIRTESKAKGTNIFIREPRRAKENNSRRSSAEFSATQASSLDLRGGSTARSWEAEVSRKMVGICMGGTEVEITKSGQARGYSSSKIPLDEPQSLGSPFLLQNTSFALSPESRSYDINYSEVEDVVKSRRKDKTPEMSQEMTEAYTGSGSRSSGRKTGRTSTRKSTVPATKTGKIPESSSLLMPPSLSFTAPTPEPSPISSTRSPRNQKARTSAPAPQKSVLRIPSPPMIQESTSSSKGKRKADEAEVEGGGTPPKEPRATFAIDPRPHRASANSSNAPSSYHRKRARLSMTSEQRPGSHGTTSSGVSNTNAANTGSWSSKNSGHLPHASRPPSASGHPQHTPSRRSLSQASIPISALISPHAPSISKSSTFHMRDPRKPAPVKSTPWSLSFPSGSESKDKGMWKGWTERGGSPMHAWVFFFGFILFPLWWVAALLGIPETRQLGGSEMEKGVILDDPQVEFDAKSWRTRCRIMAVVSLFTYIPFIILVAIFAPR